MTQEDELVGRSWTIPAPKHAGHTLTIERRDIEKHKAYWIRCSCGAGTLLGEHWAREGAKRADGVIYSPYDRPDRDAFA